MNRRVVFDCNYRNRFVDIAMNGCDSIDLTGIIIGMLSFLFVSPFAFNLLKKYGLNQVPIMRAVFVSGIGHFIGAYVLYLFAIKYGSDAIFYWQNATTTYGGPGYPFSCLILGYTKVYLLGNSFLAAFLVSGAIAFMGSIYYFLTYKVLLDKVLGPSPLYRHDAQQLVFPAYVLLCWPSYFFFSAAPTKDNIAFLSIGIILFAIVSGRINFSNTLTLCFVSFLSFMMRPYLFVVFAFSTFIYLLWMSKLGMFKKISTLIFLSLLTFVLLPLLGNYAIFVHFSGHDLAAIGRYAIRQQEYVNYGSTIPVLTHNPILVFLFLPYLICVDLFLPLGIGVSNLIGVLSSIENIYFLGLAIFFIRNRAVWKKLSLKVGKTKFLLTYSLFGMGCLSLMNSNLGIAMREKMMYVPAMLICILLTYTYKKVLIVQSSNKRRESLNSQRLL